MSDNIWWTTVYSAGRGLLRLVENPILYAALVLMVWDLSRCARAERRSFGVRVTRPWRAAGRRWLCGLAAGALVSGACLCVGVTVSLWEIAAVSALSVLLAVFRLRWMTPVYSAAVWGLVAWVASLGARASATASPLSRSWLAGFHAVDWAVVVGASALAESLWLLWARHWPVAPAALTGKRGRTIGAFVVQLSWVVPVLVLIPGGQPAPWLPPSSWPWLAPAGGVAFAAFPVVSGFHGVFAGQYPNAAVGKAVLWTAASGFAVLAGAVLSHWLGPAAVATGLVFAAALREMSVWQARRAESRAEPLCAVAVDGVRILSVLKGSLAEQMGLMPGEVITHVNHIPVHSAYDLHFAFDQNPAYAKLQVVDARGEARIVGKPVYQGERNQLGLILAPDGRRPGQWSAPAFGLLQTLYLRMVRGGERDATAVESVAPPSGS